MSVEYPFEWEENSKEDQEYRAKLWTNHNSIAVHSVISSPMNVNMPTPFLTNGIHKKIWNMKPRPDDIWLVTYPKCGTTMTQELLWQMSRGCDVNSEESKTDLTLRSPFLEASGLRGVCTCQGCLIKWHQLPLQVQDSIGYAESLTGPRILKCHLPVSMLPPSVLEISKVVLVARNVRDACVSFYHHDNLFNAIKWDESAWFEDYVKFFMDGRPIIGGDYWTHLKVSIQILNWKEL